MKASQQFIASLAEQVSMPEVYHQVRGLITDADAEIERFVRIIETDSVLARRLLRIANSAYFGFPGRANNLTQAIRLFGLIQLHDLVLTCLSLRTFATIPQQIFNLEAFWRYSVENGIAARTLAQYSQIMPMNPFFTMGLLHEVGHAAIYVKEPELAAQAFAQAQQANRPLVEVERELLGFDYTQVGTELMQLWQMPPVYHQVTACHLDIEQADEALHQTLAIVNLAHRFCQHPEPADWQQLLASTAQKDLRLNRLPSNIDKIIENEINSNADAVLAMLWPNCTNLAASAGGQSDE